MREAVGDAALLLDAAGKDVILLETVGVGQGEVEVVRLADCTIVVLMPGLGDEIQGLKAGVMEIGDIFVLNKSDYDGAAQFEHHIRAVLELAPERAAWRPPLFCTVATENKGIAELGRQITLFREHSEKAPDRHAREIARWKERLLTMLKERLMEKFTGDQAGAKDVEALATEIAARRKDPVTAVNEILARGEH